VAHQAHLAGALSLITVAELASEAGAAGLAHNLVDRPLEHVDTLVGPGIAAL
jgi:hypothetical protein